MEKLPIARSWNIATLRKVIPADWVRISN